MFYFEFRRPEDPTGKWRHDGRATKEAALRLMEEYRYGLCEVREHVWDKDKDPKRPIGCCDRWKDGREDSVAKVCKTLNRVLKREFRGTDVDFDDFSRMPPFDGYRYGNNEKREVESWRKVRFTENRFLACFPAEGSNEGHYIHINLIRYDEDLRVNVSTNLFLAKTFGGMDQACMIANRAAQLLGA